MRVGRLIVGGRLDRYVGSLFVSSYITALLVIVGLFFILDMAGNLDDFLEPWPDGSSVSGVLLARYYLLNVPFLYLQAAPFVTLTAGLFTVSRLLKHNEISAALTSGVSSHRVLMPVFMGSVVIALGMFGLREWAATGISNQRAYLLHVLKKQTAEPSYEDLWLRLPSGARARLDRFWPSTGEPPRAEFRGLDVTWPRDEDVVTSIKAEKGTWARDEAGDEFWLLDNAVRFDVGEEEARRQPERLTEVEFTPESALTFRRASESPLDLSFRETRMLASCDPDNVLYQTLLQYHLTFPLANIVLLLVGLPLMLRQERGRAVERLGEGLILCIFFFSTDFVFRNLGMQGAVHPLMASWVPILLFGSLGIVLLESMRT